MRITERRTPVSSANWQHAQFGDDDGGTDGSGYFLGGLDSETNVAFGVANDDDGLESSTLTGTGLFLDRLDLYFPIKFHQRRLFPAQCLVVQAR